MGGWGRASLGTHLPGRPGVRGKDCLYYWSQTVDCGGKALVSTHRTKHFKACSCRMFIPAVMDWVFASPPAPAPQKTHMLSLQCDGICRWSLSQVIRFRWGLEGEAPWWDECPKKERLELFLCPPCEDTMRRQPFASQKRPLRGKLSQLTPGSWHSQAPELN